MCEIESLSVRVSMENSMLEIACWGWGVVYREAV